MEDAECEITKSICKDHGRISEATRRNEMETTLNSAKIDKILFRLNQILIALLIFAFGFCGTTWIAYQKPISELKKLNENLSKIQYTPNQINKSRIIEIVEIPGINEELHLFDTHNN